MGSSPIRNAQFNQQIGLLSPALEHATPEQMFSTEEEPADAISAVKALSKANTEGQRIYELTRDNMAETLPNLNLAFETEDEIRRALNAGLTVVAHTDNVSVPGWTGAGYIIFNPDTGGGAYKISGGLSGGFSDMGDADANSSTFVLANTDNPDSCFNSTDPSCILFFTVLTAIVAVFSPVLGAIATAIIFALSALTIKTSAICDSDSDFLISMLLYGAIASAVLGFFSFGAGLVIAISLLFLIGMIQLLLAEAAATDGICLTGEP